MDSATLRAVDALVARLARGRQEAVREIVIDAVRRGHLPEMNRRALTTATGTASIADVLEALLQDRSASAAGSGPLPPVPTNAIATNNEDEQDTGRTTHP